MKGLEYAAGAAIFLAWVWLRNAARGSRRRHGARRYRITDPRGPRSATPAQRQELWRQQRGLCALCHLPLRGTRVECHHVVPWSRGGATVLANLVLVHKSPCHDQLTRAQFPGWRHAA